MTRNEPQMKPELAMGEGVTEHKISLMVDQFYERVFADDKLGPIFKQHISGDHHEHLETMKRFWRSVLLKTREYDGKPVPAHQKIDGVEIHHFQTWLGLFAETVGELFTDVEAADILTRAERIATSLWLARNLDPFQNPPVWGRADAFNQAKSNVQEGDIQCG
ncbi:MAG: group III truncated hemoglobin [Hyphomicrobiales bacterium]